MITMREGTTFDAAAPGEVAWVVEKSKDENLEARETDIRPEAIQWHSEPE
jgi:hypothetical protein